MRITLLIICCLGWLPCYVAVAQCQFDPGMIGPAYQEFCPGQTPQKIESLADPSLSNDQLQVVWIQTTTPLTSGISV